MLKSNGKYCILLPGFQGLGGAIFCDQILFHRKLKFHRVFNQIHGNILIKSSNQPCVFLQIFGKVIRTISISFAFQNRPDSSITENGKAKFLKLYPGGFAKYTYPQFQNSQELALDGGVIFNTLAKSNEFHAD